MEKCTRSQFAKHARIGKDGNGFKLEVTNLERTAGREHPLSANTMSERYMDYGTDTICLKSSLNRRRHLAASGPESDTNCMTWPC